LLQPLLLFLINHMADQPARNDTSHGTNQRMLASVSPARRGTGKGAQGSSNQSARSRIVRCAIRCHTSCRQHECHRHNCCSNGSLQIFHW
jgi:hypothetical protein